MSDQNNGSSATIPQWLKAELFEQILKKQFENYKDIKKIMTQACMAPGENYATCMLRIDIEVELEDLSAKSISFMLKVQHDNEQLKEMKKDHDVFDVEKSMYDEIIPAFEKLFANVGVTVKFGAKCYNLPIKEPHILLENLCLRGFKNINRWEGLDVEQTKCALRKMAQWHAASAAFVAAKGPFADKFQNGYLRQEAKAVVQTMFNGMSQIFLSYAKTYDNYNLYADDIHSAATTMIDELFKAAKPDPNEFNVLNHGDYCSNNIMFQYDAFGKIKETYLVDFQVPNYGSPAQDLYYLLLSSTKYEIKIKQFDYFIKHYHDHLVENLQLLNYTKKIPSLSELHATLYKYGVWGYSTVTGAMAVVLLDPANQANADNSIDDTKSSLALKTLMYSNERYRQHAEALLPWLKDRGAMNF